jgi:Secretion system C-terminal sorting domain/FG-GAP-like repeat
MNRLIFLLILIPQSLLAQFAYEIDQTISVNAASEMLTQPWGGGVNAVQVNTLDLNNDATNDLVLFDRTANKILTYLLVGNQYSYAPEYEFFFPSDIKNFMQLRDFDGDGRKDIFTGNIFGIKVYRNTTYANEFLSWTHVTFFNITEAPRSDVILTKGFSAKLNLQINFDDLPSIVDIDHDGDLDIVCMTFSGAGKIELHKNFSKERYNTLDSLDFERITQSWGQVTECGCGIFAFNNQPCNGGARQLHAGGKALLALDVDNDADVDLLFSESTCNELFWLKNEGTSENALFAQAEIFPNTFQTNGLYPVPFFEDVDVDGTQDLVISPGVFTRSDEETNFSNSFHFYKNTGSNINLVLNVPDEGYLQKSMIDVGENAVPAFFDYDADGDYDLFISSLGKENAAGAFIGSIYLYKNVGSSASPTFQFETDDYAALSQFQLYNIKIQFADINADGKIDLTFTATDIATVTGLYYMLNTSNNGLQVGSTLGTTPVTILFNENVHLTEINDDGSRDLLIGRVDGSVEYWKKTHSASQHEWLLQNAAYLGLGETLSRQNPSMLTADLNGDSKLDLALTNQRGVIQILSDFKTNTDFSEAESNLVQNSLTKQYEDRNLGGRIWLTAAKLTESEPLIFVGNMLGGLQVLRSTTFENNFEVYPNPQETSGKIFVETTRSGTVQLFDTLGKMHSAYAVLKGTNEIDLPLLEAGVYLLQFRGEGKTLTRRIVVY